MKVVIAGGGFAALEAMLALRALAANRIRITLVCPDPVLHYRPAATSEAFADVAERRYDWRAITEDLTVTYHRARLEAVAPERKWIRLATGTRVEYDALILAIGARARAGVPGALTFRDQRDMPLLRAFVDELERGVVGRAVFALPSGSSWPLPLYELALFAAGRARERHVDAEIAIVTPEQRPLELFGPEASRLVAELLEERGVRFVGKSVPAGVLRDGSLAVEFDGPIKADRVVAVPELRGQRIAGVPASWWGFVPTDAVGRVQGLADVYAAGDMTTFPIKQGGLAAQQADRVAQLIAGANRDPVRVGWVLRARLLGGDDPVFLRTELDAFGHPGAAVLERGSGHGGEDSAKVFGRYLSPYLERQAPAA